ncbi:MAG: hypothetical protein LBR70_00025 [Lactobacillaceae bacterium]|jgi:hypothetical protein|nr:hypothetical protein [Lactobacillaceae bacterium]
MKYLGINILNIKRAILVTLAFACLSTFFIKDGLAQDISSAAMPNNEIRTTTRYSEKTTFAFAAEKMKNEVCDVQNMRKRYTSSCYSCLVVKTLTETFMNACAKVYPLSREAGSKILLIASVLWLVMFALGNVSSFTSLEPANNVQDFFTFLFKVLVAAVFINAGVGILVKYIFETILIAGADYGLGVMTSVTGFSDPTPEYQFKGAEVISAKTINKLFGVNMAIDKTVSENLVIGNALICHANNAGAWVDVSFLFLFSLKIPNFWLMICGAAIWFAGFMLTLSISYYLLDISFKLGFAIIVLPIAIALWPFGFTKDKLAKVFSIVLKSGGIFAFLAITTSYSLELISAAMGGLDEFYDRIANDDATWIAARFEITGPFFIIIIFAYLYSIKMIGGTIKNYVDKFFKDAAFGSASPIHSKATQATDMVKQKSVALGKSAAKAGGKAAVLGAKGLIRGAKNGETGGTTIAGNAMKAAGRFVQFAGRSTAAVGNLNKKLQNKLQNFSDKQIQKGMDKPNVLRLAAGSLAGKAAKAKLPLTNSSAMAGNKLQRLGQKVENAGLKTNQLYRDKVRNPTINAAKDGAKWVGDKAKQGGQAVKGAVKQGAHYVGDNVKGAAKYVADEVKKSEGYQIMAQDAKAVADFTKKTGRNLVAGYVSAAASAKGAALGVAHKTGQVAQQVGNAAADLGKRTWVYKGGKFAGEKAIEGSRFVAKKTIEGGQFVKGATLQGVQVAKDYAVNSAVYKAGEATVDFAKRTDRSIRDGAISMRSGVGETVGRVKDTVRENANALKAGAVGLAKGADELRKSGGRAINQGIYNVAGGEALAKKYEADTDARLARIAAADEAKAQRKEEKAERKEERKAERDFDKSVSQGKKTDKDAQEKDKNKDDKGKDKNKDGDKSNDRTDQKLSDSERKQKFDQEYKELLRRYNVTDADSVDSLSGDRRAALKDGINRLKSKYNV